MHAAWLLTCCGLRRGEVLGLRWSDIDWEAATLNVHTSRTSVAGDVVEGLPNRRGVRTVPLDGTTVAALKRLKVRLAEERMAATAEAYQGGTDHVVVDELGSPPRPERYSDQFAKLACKAGVPPIRLHDVRHTAVTLARSQGTADQVVAAVLGHDEAVMQRTYTHTYLTDMRAAVERLRGVCEGCFQPLVRVS